MKPLASLFLLLLASIALFSAQLDHALKARIQEKAKQRYTHNFLDASLSVSSSFLSDTHNNAHPQSDHPEGGRVGFQLSIPLNHRHRIQKQLENQDRFVAHCLTLHQRILEMTKHIEIKKQYLKHLAVIMRKNHIKGAQDYFKTQEALASLSTKKQSLEAQLAYLLQ